MGQPRRLWTTDEDTVIRYHYPRLDTTDLAAALGRTPGAVRARANDLGVIRPHHGRHVRTTNARRPWTAADDDHLREWFGQRSLARLGRDLGRTAVAVKVRVTRLGIRRSPNVLTLQQVSVLFGVDNHLTKRWIVCGLLRATRLPLRTHEGRMYDISPDSLERFIREHPAAYPWRRMEPGYWRDLAESVWRADPLLLVPDVARLQGVSWSCVTAAIRAGRLSARRGYGANSPWYITRSDARRFQPVRPELVGHRGRGWRDRLPVRRTA